MPKNALHHRWRKSFYTVSVKTGNVSQRPIAHSLERISSASVFSMAWTWCPLKAQCTPSNYRRISRWEHDQFLEAMRKRLERTPNASRFRRQTVEHPLGTLKAWMGSTHFLTKTLRRVQAEMSLHVLAYNLKRAMKILGTQPLMQAMRV
jgi:transposase